MSAIDLTLLMDLGLIIIAATLTGYLTKILKQPPIVSYLVAGILIGPFALGGLGIVINNVPIGISFNQMQNIQILSELGVAFMLFYVGAQTDFSKIQSLGKTVFFGGIIQVVLTFIATYTIALLAGLGPITSVYIGFIFSFSSTMMVVKILNDSKETQTLHGLLMIGFLLVQDLIVIIVLPLLAQISGNFTVLFLFEVLFKGILLFSLGYIINRYILPKIVDFATSSSELFYLTGLSVCFGFIGIAWFLDFSIAIGAFIGGLALSSLPYNLEINHNIRGLRDFFSTIFFVTLGMQIGLTPSDVPVHLLVALLIVVYILKPVIYSAITILTGYGPRIGIKVALGLTQVSEFSFILVSQGFANGTGPISSSLFTLTTIIIALSMATTPYVIGSSEKTYQLSKTLFKIPFLKKFSKQGKKIKNLTFVPASEMKNGIVLVGGGSLGSGIIELFNKPFANSSPPIIVIDNNASIIRRLIRRGIHAIYGSTTNKDIWEQINLKNIKLFIITIPNSEMSELTIKKVRNENPNMAIFARAHYTKDALRLYKAGADLVVLPEILASNTLVKYTAELIKKKDVSTLSNFKNEYLEYLKEKSEEK